MEKALKLIIKAIEESGRRTTSSAIEITVETSEGPRIIEMSPDICDHFAVVLRIAANEATVLRQSHGAPPGALHVSGEPRRLASATMGFLADGETFVIRTVTHDRQESPLAMTASQARRFAEAVLASLEEEEPKRPAH